VKTRMRTGPAMSASISFTSRRVLSSSSGMQPNLLTRKGRGGAAAHRTPALKHWFVYRVYLFDAAGRGWFQPAWKEAGSSALAGQHGCGEHRVGVRRRGNIREGHLLVNG